jgi:hypothetical protein
MNARLPCMVLKGGVLWLAASVLFPGVSAAGEQAGKPKVVRINAADYPNLQAAVDALPGRVGEVYLPRGEYVLERTLDLSSKPGGYQGGIKLAGCGRGSRIVAKTRGQPVVDLTGTNHCIMENLWITAENAGPDERPNVGLLLGRNRDGGAAQEHRFTNVIFSGHFTVANVYNVTSELCRFVGCIFINTSPGSHNLVWSSENFAAIKSPYRGEIRTLYSNTELRIIGCTFYNWGGAGGDNLHFRGFTMDTTVRDCYMNPPKGGHAVYLGMSSKGGPVESACFEGIRIEADNAADVFVMKGRHENLAIRNCSIMYGEGLFLRGEEVNTLTVQNCMIWNIRGWKTAMRFDRLLNARITDNVYRFQNWGGKNPQQGPERLVSGDLCRGSLVEVGRREQVDFKTLEGSEIDALDDGGVRRRYLGSAAAGTVLNMTPVNTAKLTNCKAGDIAVDDGKNTKGGKPGLAVFDGRQWQYMN